MRCRYVLRHLMIFIGCVNVCFADEQKYVFDIAKGDAGTALTYFAKQAELTLLFPHDRAKQIVVGPLKGRYTIIEALNALFNNAPVEYELVKKTKTTGDTPGEASFKNALIYLDFQEKQREEAPTIAEPEVDLIEEVVTISTRAKSRNVDRSPSPIDLLSGQQIQQSNITNTANVFRSLIPSFTINDHPISDAATLVRPSNMRGLAPDHVLLLVDGKRRHRSSVITWQGNGVADGAQGPDFSSIPASAIESVELLRDGAAAQYGSDAIAGVINVRLKKDTDAARVSANYGQYTDGNEALYAVSFNKGLPLNDDGFLFFVAEYSEAEATSRTALRSDVALLIADGYADVPVPAIEWGTPEISDNYKTFINFSTPLYEDISLYGYGNYSKKRSEGSFFYRDPTSRRGVYGNNEQLLIGALNGDIESCPQVRLNGNLPEQDAFNSILEDENCFSFQEIIPGGFTPRFGATLTDSALLLGISDTSAVMTWDLSSYYGFHESDFFIENTVNASLGPDSPRNFAPGKYAQTEINLNGDFTFVPNADLALAFGFEKRIEQFTITEGEPASYIDGGLGAQGFSTSSNGFPGFSPSVAGRWRRSNFAAYLDIEYDLTDTLLIASAIRSEYFDDFGLANNAKFGLNWSPNNHLGFRSTYSTGFKAPTPGQANATNLTTQSTGVSLVTIATIPATSSVSRSVGARDLLPEKSQNFSFGTYIDIGPVRVQADYFYIAVKDRLTLSSINELTPELRDQLASEGTSNVSDFDQFRYFTNGFDTRTTGIEINSHYRISNNYGKTGFNLSYSYHNNRVTSWKDSQNGAGRLKLIEEALPRQRWIFAIDHRFKNISTHFKTHYFGSFYDAESRGRFNSAFLFDLDLTYSPTHRTEFSFGVDNIFNEKGCSIDSCSQESSSDLGQKYSQYSPFGFNGRLLYSKVEVT